jgi:DNA polymerase I
VAELRACMAEASRIVLGGFEVRTDAEIVRWPDRYADPRGKVMWATVMRLLGEVKAAGERCAEA